MSKTEEKNAIELMKKAKDFIPDGGYSEKELNLAFFMFIKGYHQAEKDLELTWGDLKLLQNMSNEVFAEVVNGSVDYYQIYPTEQSFLEEVLKRFKSYGKKEI